jgi:hypothetical protein
MLFAVMGFLGGVVVCGVAVACLLPAMVRSQCAKSVRLYEEFLRPQNTNPVIVIERTAARAAPPLAGPAVRRRFDAPTTLPGTADTTLRVDPGDSPGHASVTAPGARRADTISESRRADEAH